jgi:uncharacterized LabA/DUF88 family protein
MSGRSAGVRVGVYVDVENIMRNGGRGLRYDVLREFACRDGAQPVRLNAYLAFDGEWARRDPEYRDRSLRFHFALRDVGFKVIEKPVQWYTNEDGVRVSKANSDLDLAVDLLLQSAKLDRVVLVSGDGDFTQVVRALQNMGCRVELLAFQNVSYELRCEADFFLSGYLVPNLLPRPEKGPGWGEIESRVRGTCYHFNPEKGFGFLRYIVSLDNLAMTDARGPGSPYRQAFFHYSNTRLTNAELHQLPSRDMVFEFTLDRGRVEGEMAAKDVELVNRYQSYAVPEQRPAEPRPEFRSLIDLRAQAPAESTKPVAAAAPSSEPPAPGPIAR